jgi:hypothetical protein
MTSETREVAHNQHTHPTNRFYLIVGAILIGLTVLEVLGYLGEENGTLARGRRRRSSWCCRPPSSCWWWRCTCT